MTSQQVSLLVDDLTIRGELYLAQNDPSPAVVLCHGLPAGTIDPADPGYPGLARRLQAQGFSTLIFNFRGCGQSQGDLDMAGWRRDLASMVDFLCNTQQPSKLFVVGSSAGGAASVPVVAGDARVSGLALMACPASFDQLRREKDARALLEHCRRVGTIRDPSFPPSLDQWLAGFIESSPERWIGGLSPRPVLIVHGDRDDVVLVENARRLYAKAGEPKELAVLPGLGHRLRHHEQAVATMLGWLKQQAGLN